MSAEMTPRAKGPDQKFCFECGGAINAKAEICPKCGVRQMPPPSPLASPPTALRSAGERKSKFSAGLIALFLGGIGIHKFYLNRTKEGVLYLLFCWTLVPSVLGLLDALNLFTMNQTLFDERYNSF